MKSQVLHTVWCYITGEAAGEIYCWSLVSRRHLESFKRLEITTPFWQMIDSARHSAFSIKWHQTPFSIKNDVYSILSILCTPRSALSIQPSEFLFVADIPSPLVPAQFPLRKQPSRCSASARCWIHQLILFTKSHSTKRPSNLFTDFPTENDRRDQECPIGQAQVGAVWKGQ